MKRLLFIAVLIPALLRPASAALPAAERERRIEELLGKMTLEEKLGQLQQLDGEAHGPYRPEHVELAKKGLLGSTLNVRGAKRVNELQFERDIVLGQVELLAASRQGRDGLRPLRPARGGQFFTELHDSTRQIAVRPPLFDQIPKETHPDLLCTDEQTDTHSVSTKGSVLVVDDDPDIRRLICDGLSWAGFNVVAAKHGREALDHLKGAALPDLIVLDLVMPVMDGWEFRRQQVGDPSLATIPVLILTVVEAPLMPTGAAAYLKKPFEFPRLINIVSILCQQRRGAAAILAAEGPAAPGRQNSLPH